MATTFNPHNYSRSDFEAALSGGKDYYEDKRGILDSLSTINGTVASLQKSVGDVSSDLALHKQSNDSNFSTVNSKISSIKDLLDQVIYKGSNNRIDLTGATISTVSSDVTASLSGGILTFRKTSTTSSDSSIVITGVAIEAGSYYVSTGDNLNSDDEIVSMSILDHSGTAVGYPVSNTDDMIDHYVTIAEMAPGEGETDTTGSIEITIDKDFSSHVYYRMIPVCAVDIYDKEFSTPKFSAITEV
jgi:hypothetical protein